MFQVIEGLEQSLYRQLEQLKSEPLSDIVQAWDLMQVNVSYLHYCIGNDMFAILPLLDEMLWSEKLQRLWKRCPRKRCFEISQSLCTLLGFSAL